jgi:hypothetical protein
LRISGSPKEKLRHPSTKGGNKCGSAKIPRQPLPGAFAKKSILQLWFSHTCASQHITSGNFSIFPECTNELMNQENRYKFYPSTGRKAWIIRNL